MFKLQLKNPSSDLDNNDIIDYDEEDYDYVDGEKWQLLPPVEASKSIVRFRVDPEQPAQSLLPPAPSVTKQKPPRRRPSSPSSPVAPVVSPFQLVGHVMTDDELKAFPDSPIVNISLSSDGSMTSSKKKHDKMGEADAVTSEVGRPRGHSPRTGKSGDGGISLPVQLGPPGGGLPGPLVWISPASLARSPMVNLRRLRPNQVHADPPNVERTLTMVFPGRQRRRFEASCLKCLSEGGICPHCLVVR